MQAPPPPLPKGRYNLVWGRNRKRKLNTKQNGKYEAIAGKNEPTQESAALGTPGKPLK